jgi:hypothetical protein
MFFSEEKNQKTFAPRLGCGFTRLTRVRHDPHPAARLALPPRLGARATAATEKSLFGSFSSEKEHAYF